MNKIKLDLLKSKGKKIPGSLIYTGDSGLSTTITHYAYKNHKLHQSDDLYTYSEKHTNWVSVEGFKNVELIKEFCDKIGLDQLLVEDILHVHQRNKFVVNKDYLFMILKYPVLQNHEISFRYISFVLRKDSIVTFTDYENPFSNEIKDRVDSIDAPLSKQNEDYLLYVIYDMIVDEQIELVKQLSNQLNEFESVILELNQETSNSLYTIHKRLVVLRNNIKSLQENISPNELLKTDFVSDSMDKYIGDLDDHLRNLYERATTNIEICNSLILMYSNQLSNRTNEIMKTLTIISIVFIPLSFFAGVFGMNFTNFDLLQATYGIPFFFLFSAVLAMVMLYYFKRKNWF